MDPGASLGESARGGVDAAEPRSPEGKLPQKQDPLRPRGRRARCGQGPESPDPTPAWSLCRIKG